MGGKSEEEKKKFSVCTKWYVLNQITPRCRQNRWLFYWFIHSCNRHSVNMKSVPDTVPRGKTDDIDR